jgi:hypothetical protein
MDKTNLLIKPRPEEPDLEDEKEEESEDDRIEERRAPNLGELDEDPDEL